MFKCFKNKKIIITGHTGFKGSWLLAFLSTLNCKIFGISKDIPTNPSHYKLLNIKKNFKNIKLDVRDKKAIVKAFKQIQPDFVFHLAAQSLVKTSYNFPELTFNTNAIGTLNILEALRNLKKKCTVVLITSDKSYKNIEISRGYKETDIIGGEDPYSSSKGCAELIIRTYVNSFFTKENRVRIAVARAGNVVGGGDWSKDRLIPDCIKSWVKNRTVLIRSPYSTRPWQHVIEIIYGYLVLAKNLNKNQKLHGEIFNLGPAQKANYSVIQVLRYFRQSWEKCKWKIAKHKSLEKESKLLKLNSNKAKKILKWKTNLNLRETLEMTLSWYRSYYINKEDMYKISINQINDYLKNIKKVN